ncbi:unannotated protein [freshwater metagenome]|uniref:Unannotated protein n=1 Tax=freshwater metagenome TaxID=449393 RepID=A0A6J6RFK9_9ZZZZ
MTAARPSFSAWSATINSSGVIAGPLVCWIARRSTRYGRWGHLTRKDFDAENVVQVAVTV